jgi:hypothetical protein
LERVVGVFPQCDDTVKKGKGKLVAHVSVAKCKNENELNRVLAKIQATYRPISFTLKEIYLLHRWDPMLFYQNLYRILIVRVVART